MNSSPGKQIYDLGLDENPMPVPIDLKKVLIELIKLNSQILQQNYLKILFYPLHIHLRVWVKKNLLI